MLSRLLMNRLHKGGCSGADDVEHAWRFWIVIPLLYVYSQEMSTSVYFVLNWHLRTDINGNNIPSLRSLLVVEERMSSRSSNGLWQYNKVTQEGWLSPTERASVSAISLRHVLASPRYIPGTIAVNVTWVERGFNAGQTHRSIYPSIFNRLRAIARYWLEIATFSYPFAYPLEFQEKVWVLRKLESWGYHFQVVKTVWRSVEPFWHNTSVWRTDRQTDRRRAYINNVRTMTDAH